MAATKMIFGSGSNFGRLLGSLLKYNAPEDFLEVFQDIFWKSSGSLPGSLPGSLLMESSPMSSFHNRYERFDKVFNQIVLIFYLDMFFRSGFDIHVFRSGSDFGRLMESLLRSLLKYNGFSDVF
ncbi:hypothetical protein F2Q69_00049628 [Brassica cretica]|uniref:Uncharacterized protein n=1 Tax=Brassica cretica TaxID=69181 RepID=A0A8S9PFV7_BRACR|nr:hypothetical protein F2Q69_00049628 [Brassica cretica]